MTQRSQPIMAGVRNLIGTSVPSLLILATSLLLAQNIGVVTSYQCYQCVYTNITRYLEKQLPINNAPAGKQMVPVDACSDTNTTISAAEESDFIEINKDCPYGCVVIVMEFRGKKIVNRGCVSKPTLCSNFTFDDTSQTCCKGNLCNGGPHKKPQGGPYSCYQCVGSTSNTSKVSMNVYASKTMTVTKDCLDDSFKPNSPHVEVNHNCMSGCLSATMVPTGDTRNRIVMRGCAQPKGLPCISMDLNRDVLKMIGGMDKYDNMAQKCCNAPFCNAGIAVNFVTYNSSSFETEYKLHNEEKSTTDKPVNTAAEKGKTRRVIGGAVSTIRQPHVAFACSFSILTFLLSLAVS